MDRSYVEWLTGLFDLTEAQAEAIAGRFPSYEALRTARREDLAALPGLTAKDVDALLEELRPEATGEGEAELFLCPVCGSFAARGSQSCPRCGAAFDEPAEETPAGPPPDPAFLEWLRSSLGIDAEEGRDLAARFPTFEHLRVATTEELIGIAELTPHEAERIRSIVTSPSGIGADGKRFLCVECGSFSAGAATCMVCGADAGGESLPREPERLGPSLASETCPGCGSPLSDPGARCDVCGREPSAAETVPEQNPFAPVDASVPVCARCGAYRSDDLEECPVCGGPAGEPIIAEPPSPKGVGRGFLSRWRRVAEGEGLPAADPLREELDHYDRVVEADPRLERAWAQRGRVLGQLGLAKEAVESLFRAAELDPAKDETYRREALSILGGEGDLALLPPKWRPPAPVPVEPVLEAAPPNPSLLAALRRYEALLAAQPGLAAAWRTKGELLGQLGRTEEARNCVDRAVQIEGHESRGRIQGVAGLQTAGVTRTPRGQPREAGHINGRVNGRVNGLTNGRVNGVTFPRGATNGLVNGDGFTNGRAGRYAPVHLRHRRSWARSVFGIAAIGSIMVLIPLVASLLAPPFPGAEIIRIDSEFGDWAGFPEYVDSAVDQTLNPSANLLATKVAKTENAVFIYARMQGLLFEGRGPNGTESLYVFVDEDGDASTGYRIADFGADALTEVFGWAGTIEGSNRFSFRSLGPALSDDWNGFVSRGFSSAAARNNEIEIRMSADRASRAMRLLVFAADDRGNRDASDGTIRPPAPTVIVDQRTVAPDVVTVPRASFLRVALEPLGGVATVSAINMSREGQDVSSLTLAAYIDDGSGLLDARDELLSSRPALSSIVSLPINRSFAAPTVLWIEAQWSSPVPGTTFGVRVQDLWTDASTSFRPPDLRLVYLGSSPSGLIVDGAFGDWQGRAYGQDLLGDVADPASLLAYNANVDILATAVDVASNFTAYVRVDGRILGGEDIPAVRIRPAPAAPTDTDQDGVPDAVEVGLGNPALRFDFNNDNVTDNRTNGDVDGDGVLDYPAGGDLWLNTTIPSWYPAPYALRPVARYIGPVAPSVHIGADALYVYVDRDNESGSGLPTDIDGRRFGFDFAIAVLGRSGRILSAGLYAFDSGNITPWRFVRAVDAGLDGHRIELGVTAGALSLGSTYRVAFYASDWRLSYDAALPDALVSQFSLDVHVVATTVVINEISPRPNPEWIELANPTAPALPLLGWRLQRRAGGSWVTIFTFSGQVLGAWGSGTQYLSVFLPSNSLPNVAERVRLLNAGSTIVDETRYSQMQDGLSWARFKDAQTGQPSDSNNDAVDFYRSTLPSSGQPNDLHRPVISVAKVANRTTAAPGETISYTVFYNNTGSGNAAHVWLNDTLPSGVTFVSSSAPPTGNIGRTYFWHFLNVTSGPKSLIVQVRVNGGIANGAALPNLASLSYTDQLNRSLPRSSDWANVTVSRPVIAIAKIVSPANAVPGQVVTFTIYYNNTGSAPAGTVTIKDTLPSGLTYVASTPLPTWTDGRTFYWNFTTVVPGPHSIVLSAQVDALAGGPLLVNWAFLNYTTMAGFPLESSAASAIVAIPELSHVFLLPVVPLLILASVRRIARIRRRGRRSVRPIDSNG